MQVTIYVNDEDKYLLDLVDEEAQRTRRSRSAVVAAALEAYFLRGKKVGEVLLAMKAINPQDLEKVLAEQKKRPDGKLLGELLVHRGLVSSDVVQKALWVQERLGHKKRGSVARRRPSKS